MKGSTSPYGSTIVTAVFVLGGGVMLIRPGLPHELPVPGLVLAEQSENGGGEEPPPPRTQDDLLRSQRVKDDPPPEIDDDLSKIRPGSSRSSEESLWWRSLFRALEADLATAGSKAQETAQGLRGSDRLPVPVVVAEQSENGGSDEPPPPRTQDDLSRYGPGVGAESGRPSRPDDSPPATGEDILRASPGLQRSPAPWWRGLLDASAAGLST